MILEEATKFEILLYLAIGFRQSWEWTNCVKDIWIRQRAVVLLDHTVGLPDGLTKTCNIQSTQGRDPIAFL
jgi:hypothetical protein